MCEDTGTRWSSTSEKGHLQAREAFKRPFPPGPSEETNPADTLQVDWRLDANQWDTAELLGVPPTVRLHPDNRDPPAGLAGKGCCHNDCPCRGSRGRECAQPLGADFCQQPGGLEQGSGTSALCDPEQQTELSCAPKL